jgi:hypothetical protein
MLPLDGSRHADALPGTPGSMHYERAARFPEE